MLSEGFLRDFFKLPGGKKSRVDETCPKCGCTMNVLEYNRIFKRIDIRCVSCKYNWSVEPLDATPAKPGAVE